MPTGNLGQQTLVSITINSRLLAEESDVSVERDSKAIPVSTVAKQFAGMSPGAAMMQIEVTSAVPSLDFEQDPGPAIENLEVVDVALFCAGRTLVTKGFITKDTLSHGVSSESKLKFTIVCKFANWT